MELIDKINATIDRLEELKKQSHPDIDSLKELIDTIENEEYHCSTEDALSQIQLFL